MVTAAAAAARGACGACGALPTIMRALLLMLLMQHHTRVPARCAAAPGADDVVEAVTDVLSDVPAALTTTAVTLAELAKVVADLNLTDVFTTASLEALMELQDLKSSNGSSDSQAAAVNQSLLGTAKLLKHYNYTFVNHTVRTEDGYLLGVFRLPRPGHVPVFLMHGILSSSADFVVNGPDRALALLLYDEGYDVWLGNARGNSESRRHETLNTSQAALWNFSFHEIGERDLPALIDYVLNATDQDSLHCIAHSQGTTSFFVLGSERPEYMAKVKTFVALAPVAFLRDMSSIPVRLLAIAPNTVGFLLKLIGVNELLARDELITWLANVLCGDDDSTQSLCENLYFLFLGYDSQQLLEDLIPLYLINVPAGASTKQLIHFGQLIGESELVFRKYDYGSAGNLERYGASEAPEYNLTGLTAPTYLFHSDNDVFAVPSNIAELENRLPNVIESYRVPLTVFNHVDFLYGSQAKQLCYDAVLEFLNRQEEEDEDDESSSG